MRAWNAKKKQLRKDKIKKKKKKCVCKKYDFEEK